MIKYLKSIDKVIKAEEMKRYKIAIPEIYWSTFIRVSRAAEHSYILNKLIEDQTRKKPVLNCLIVGVWGGRDYWNLKAQGHNVYGLDLGIIPECPNTKLGNAEETWPYDNQIFDVVVMGEILEHLHYDSKALQEVRRTIKPDGTLIITVPYLDSNDRYHIRMHDPLTIKKLLEINGFVVEKALERPGIIQLAVFNYINYIITAFWYFLFRKSIYGKLTNFFGYIEWKLGQRTWLPRKILKVCKLINWGGTLKCSPSESRYNYLEQNVKAYSAD